MMDCVNLFSESVAYRHHLIVPVRYLDCFSAVVLGQEMDVTESPEMADTLAGAIEVGKATIDELWASWLPKFPEYYLWYRSLNDCCK